MTQEAQGHHPEEAPAPPATTRWSEEPAGEDDVLAPPFVPGRPSSAAARPQVEDAAVEEIAPEPLDEVAPEPLDEIAPEAPDEEPFPFDATYPAGEPEAAEPVEAAEAAPAPEVAEVAEVAEVTESAEDDFPFDRFDIEGTDPASPEPETEISAGGMGWTPADLDLEELAGETPRTAKEGEGERPAGAESGGAPAAAAPAAEGESAAAGVESDAAAEAAALLERLSGVLRTQGEEGVRQEMESPDRMTALLAGLLAGYVSGRS